MKRSTSMLAALALVGLTSAAQAEEHTILILPDAFFPDISIVSPGDQIRFVNMQEDEANVISEGEDWSIGPIPVSGEEVITVSNSMETAFFDADQADADGNMLVQGQIDLTAGG